MYNLFSGRQAQTAGKSLVGQREVYGSLKRFDPAGITRRTGAPNLVMCLPMRLTSGGALVIGNRPEPIHTNKVSVNT